jgi:hypothetical protein
MNERHSRTVECYEKVLDICHKKIVLNSEKKKTRFFYEVPEYLFGYPVFDLNDCIKFLIDSLTKNGFLAVYYFPKFIYISWDFEEIDEHKKGKAKLPTVERKNVLDFKYKPSGKLTLDLD